MKISTSRQLVSRRFSMSWNILARFVPSFSAACTCFTRLDSRIRIQNLTDHVKICVLFCYTKVCQTLRFFNCFVNWRIMNFATAYSCSNFVAYINRDSLLPDISSKSHDRHTRQWNLLYISQIISFTLLNHFVSKIKNVKPTGVCTIGS